jgi:hypothetical protein
VAHRRKSIIERELWFISCNRSGYLLTSLQHASRVWSPRQTLQTRATPANSAGN